MDNAGKLMKVYNALLEKYGSQGWWPVTPIGGCKGDLPDAPAYGIAVHNERQKLEIIFGAILTQNTQWKPNVENAIIMLNSKDLIDVDKILKTRHEELAGLIKSAGYFNQKAKKLKNVAAFIKKYPIARLRGMDLWKARELLLSVNGIGPETADSILLYALDKPIFVVDAYTRRIFSRLGLIKSTAAYEEIQLLFMSYLEHDQRMFNEYHALIVEHAKQHCMKKPECGGCPIRAFCHYRV